MTGAGTDDTPCPSRLADRLLAALVCVREEAAGHPADGPALRKAIQQMLGRGLGMLLLVVALAGFSGAFAAAAALDAGPPVSLLLVLLVLLVWLLCVPLSRRVTPSHRQ